MFCCCQTEHHSWRKNRSLTRPLPLDCDLHSYNAINKYEHLTYGLNVKISWSAVSNSPLPSKERKTFVLTKYLMALLICSYYFYWKMLYCKLVHDDQQMTSATACIYMQGSVINPSYNAGRTSESFKIINGNSVSLSAATFPYLSAITRT